MRWSDGGKENCYRYPVPGRLPPVADVALVGEARPGAAPAGPASAAAAAAPGVTVGRRCVRGPDWKARPQPTASPRQFYFRPRRARCADLLLFSATNATAPSSHSMLGSQWNAQDGGAGGGGTVVAICGGGWIRVQWDR